ncbi:hypothetical protein IAT40_001777 [Kwoniella sp. CBS 6097]
MSSNSRPNILFIMADDHAAKAIGCYGAGINNTPNLDRLANEGMLFNHCYVTNSICTPSRATILTGTHNHVNNVRTLDSKIDKELPNVAKHLRAYGGYQTAMIGKWHLGEGDAHEPTGFDYWDIVPGQGQYYDPLFLNAQGQYQMTGYATDIITDKTIDFMKNRNTSRPFFIQCHHKAPHRSWENHPRHSHLYQDKIKLPDTFRDDYKNRAKAASVAKMKVVMDMTYKDLGLAQPEGGAEAVGVLEIEGHALWTARKVLAPQDVTKMAPLIDINTGEKFTFSTREELEEFKYQRYMQRYLRTIQAIDDSVGRLLDYLDEEGLAENTMVLYTSDQGFFLGEHGWFDKRFMYEESFQMPLMIRAPKLIRRGSICNDIVSNVDFAATWIQYAGLKVPTYMQGDSFLDSLMGKSPQNPSQVAYHRYWMHADPIHNAYAHYGVRGKRYKLIFWYNDGLNLPGTGVADGEQEWELFDCEEDPLELFNLWDSNDPSVAGVREEMVRLLERKMIEIGDVPVHPVDLPAEQLAEKYKLGANIAARAQALNM